MQHSQNYDEKFVFNREMKSYIYFVRYVLSLVVMSMEIKIDLNETVNNSNLRYSHNDIN
jgi:hypothetical protein